MKSSSLGPQPLLHGSQRGPASAKGLRFSWVVAFVLAFVLPFSAGATVKKEGTWPSTEKKVSLEFEGKPSEGLKQLAKAAGWSLVVSKDVAVDQAAHGGSPDVNVDVKSQPADAVLEALFVGHDVVAQRNGTLITVTPAHNAAAPVTPVAAVEPPEPPEPPEPVVAPAAPEPIAAPTPPPPPNPPTVAPPVPTVRGEDRNVFGGNLVIHKNEIVHTVSVTGGSVKVEGTVTGDLVVAGGSAKVLNGARVIGNATVFGGSLKIEKNARIDGDVAIAGGSLHREDGAVIGGQIVNNRKGSVNVTGGSDDTHDEESDGEATPAVHRSRVSEALYEFGQSMTRMALLFVLGCVLLALLTPRMEKLRVEIATRPMRSFALGLVGTLLGSIGMTILIVVLCITVIGIPVAIVGVLFAVLALYGAIASVLTTAGAAVIGHRTQNPYLHLLLGCAAFLVLSSIPYIGGLVTFAVAMIAVGALISTRAGGLLDRGKRRLSTGLV